MPSEVSFLSWLVPSQKPHGTRSGEKKVSPLMVSTGSESRRAQRGRGWGPGYFLKSHTRDPSKLPRRVISQPLRCFLIQSSWQSTLTFTLSKETKLVVYETWGLYPKHIHTKASVNHTLYPQIVSWVYHKSQGKLKAVTTEIMWNKA